MKNSQNKKIELITTQTLIVRVDIAKISVGMTLGIEGVKVRLMVLLENFEQNERHLEMIEKEMEK